MCYCDVLQGQEESVTAVQDDENATQDNTQEDTDASRQEAVSSPTVFVTRRGKRNGSKRKISDPESVTECDAKLPPSAAEVLHIIMCSTQIHDDNRRITK